MIHQSINLVSLRKSEQETKAFRQPGLFLHRFWHLEAAPQALWAALQEITSIFTRPFAANSSTACDPRLDAGLIGPGIVRSPAFQERLGGDCSNAMKSEVSVDGQSLSKNLFCSCYLKSFSSSKVPGRSVGMLANLVCLVKE